MLTLKKMNWSYMFSYGASNSVDFSNAPLTQVLGLNGHGKSSIALVLEEILFNKNSKGIKKGSILNRNAKSKQYTADLEFEKDGKEYLIAISRANTQTVTLLCDGEDISGHTATGTYKIIEDILGLDHKAFSQIVYQSTSSSLEFLTATDTNRKKFLIELMNLGKYVEIGDVFKAAAKDADTLVTKFSTAVKTAESWIAKYAGTSLDKIQVVDVPEAPRSHIEEVARIKVALADIDATNKKISKNNKYKELLDGLVVEPVPAKPDTDTSKLVKESIHLTKTVSDAKAFVNKMNALGSKCPTCLSEIDTDKISSLISARMLEAEEADKRIKEISATISKLNALESEWSQKAEIKRQFEEYTGLYNSETPRELLDAEELKSLISRNEQVIQKINKAIASAEEHNRKASSHNAKVETIQAQLVEMREEVASNQRALQDALALSGRLNILVKTFSPSGLVAYKIECMIKDLEDATNLYLGDMSGGRFQLRFVVSGTDKLNVVITDNGKDVEIVELSSGERARVNTAALLGIRKLMQALSNTRINLLILDETIENLDVEGKEKLVEILLKEEHLNTFVVSHGFSHPLLEKLTAIKENNISRLEA